MKSKVLSTENSEAFILQLITLIAYCAVPPVILVLAITVAAALINSATTSSIYALVICQQTLPVTISYAVLPLLVFSTVGSNSLGEIGIKKNKNRIITIVDIIAIGLFGAYIIINGVLRQSVGVYVIHYFFLAISEEILVRGIILSYLRRLITKDWISILLSALIFALVFHSTDEIVSNIIYRVPFGIIAAILYKKTGSLQSSALFHWIYNVMMTLNYL